MSQHSSLKSGSKDKAHRSVWKRFERLKFLVDKGKWNEGDSIFGMPKMKLIKLKIKKEKPVEETTQAEGAAAEGAVAAEDKATKPEAKAGTPERESAAKKGGPEKAEKKEGKKQR